MSDYKDDPFLKTRVYTMLCADNMLWTALNFLTPNDDNLEPKAMERLKSDFGAIRKTYFEKYPELEKYPEEFNQALTSAAVKLYFQKNETFIFL